MAYDMPGKDGLTRRERENYQDFPAVEIPSAGSLVWQMFWEINQGRQAAMGLAPLSYQEIDAWCRLSSTNLSWYELRWIKAMDTGYLVAAGDKVNLDAGRSKESPAMFSTQNVDGVKGLFAQLKAKQASE